MNNYYTYDYNINISCIYQNGNPYVIPIKLICIAESDYRSDPHLRVKDPDKREA